MKLHFASVSRVLVVAAAVFAGLASATSVNSAYRSDVDAVLAANQRGGAQIAAPGALRPQPWKVGQWALYKTQHDGDVGYERFGVVGQDDCGIWIEQVRQDYKHRSVSKICYRAMPQPPTDAAKLASAIDLVQVQISQQDGRQPTILDFRDGRNAQMKQAMQMFGASLVSFDWSDALPRRDITVPAGTFQGTAVTAANVNLGILSISVDVWVHPEVPVNGMVKSASSNGIETVLLAYGQDGATTTL